MSSEQSSGLEESRALREERLLYLEEWRSTVDPLNKQVEKWTEVAAQFGQISLKTTFYINGGALVALPPLMEWLGGTLSKDVYSAYIFFTIGIGLSFLSTVSAYANFMYMAQLNRARASTRSLELASRRTKVALTEFKPYRDDKSTVEHSEKAVTLTQWAAIIGCLGSFVLFVFGVGSFDFERDGVEETEPVQIEFYLDGFIDHQQS